MSFVLQVKYIVTEVKSSEEPTGAVQAHNLGRKGDAQIGPYTIHGSQGVVPGYGSKTLQLVFEPCTSGEHEVDLRIAMLPMQLDAPNIEPLHVHLQVCSLLQLRTQLELLIRLWRRELQVKLASRMWLLLSLAVYALQG